VELEVRFCGWQPPALYERLRLDNLEGMQVLLSYEEAS